MFTNNVQKYESTEISQKKKQFFCSTLQLIFYKLFTFEKIFHSAKDIRGRPFGLIYAVIFLYNRIVQDSFTFSTMKSLT